MRCYIAPLFNKQRHFVQGNVHSLSRADLIVRVGLRGRPVSLAKALPAGDKPQSKDPGCQGEAGTCYG